MKLILISFKLLGKLGNEVLYGNSTYYTLEVIGTLHVFMETQKVELQQFI